MVHNDLPSQLQDTLLSPGPRYFEKPIGYVCVLIATALAAFDVFLLLAVFRGNGKLWGLGTVFVCSTVLMYFFATVGSRLILNRPNIFGSIASPTAWFTCFAVFGVITVLLVADAIIKRDVGLAQTAAGSALFTLLAFGAASHFRRRKDHVR